MKEVRLDGHRVVVYNSIDELPMERFHRYNKMLLVDAGVGSEISDFDARIERCVRYIRKGENENAAKELDNLRQNVFLIMQEQGVRDLSFACLVQSVDGEPCNDISEEGLTKVLERLGGVPRRQMTDALQSVKKKIDDELSVYFPDIFNDVESKEWYDTLKRRTLAVLENIINGRSDERDRAIEDMTERMVLYSRPKVFSGSKSVEIEHDKNFESLCLTIQSETHADAKRMTVLEFYNAYEYIRRLSKERKKKSAKTA